MNASFTVSVPARKARLPFAGIEQESKEMAMTANTKSPFEHVGDVLNQLKEMRHYSKANVERLTTQWMLFDGELKKLKQAERIEELMTRQGELHEAIEAEITTLEELAVALAPKEEDAEEPSATPTKH
jgi:hypothetical protein